MGLAILVNFEFFFFMSDMLTMMLTCHVPGMKHSISLGRAFVPLIWKCGTGELWGWGTFDDLPSLELMGWGLSPLLRACVWLFLVFCKVWKRRFGNVLGRRDRPPNLEVLVGVLALPNLEVLGGFHPCLIWDVEITNNGCDHA